jgi:pSer/pThr/pTyr-binding forkhead associated (FHA) protein
MIAPILVFSLRVALVVVLYSFLCWVIYTLWRDLKFQSQILSTKKIPQILILSENDPEGSHPSFSQPEVIFGRESTCDLSFDDDTISSKHGRLFFKNLHWWVEDLSSTNGTFLNNERVVSPTILISGDEIRIGNQLLTIELQQGI